MAFATTAELAQYVEKELGHNLSGAASAQRTDIVSHLDRAHKVVLQGGGILNFTETAKGPRRKRDEVDFVFALQANPKIITLNAPYTSGFTANATSNSTSVTLSSDPSSGANLANWYIRVASDQEVYRISSNSGTAVTLDGVYVNTTVTNATCKIFQLRYDVGSSDILKYRGPLRMFGRKREVEIVDREELLNRYPMQDVQQSLPHMAGVISYSSGTLTLQMSSYPQNMERLELDWIQIPTTLDTTTPTNPILPEQHRLCLAHLAAYFMLHRNDDDRAKNHLNIARDLFDELVDYNKELMASGDSDYGRIVPNVSSGQLRRRIGVKTDYDIS